ncbi:hypothetical protein B0H13DRAFT_757118 [Mycena leptocephala]|nr:hypothetical protein B0H13DRAFT_757118 [Mycena leptocephala]
MGFDTDQQPLESGFSLESFAVVRVVIDYATTYTYSLSLVQAQIQRSQKLKIHFDGCHEKDSRPQIQMFQLLAQHSPRWEELSLGLTPELLPSLTVLCDRVSSLKRLWIEWEESEVQTIESIDCFQTAFSLVDASIHNECRVLPIALPIHQLTRYQLDGPWEMHRGILKLAPNLVEARIELSYEGPWSDPAEAIDLLCLRRLYVSNLRALRYIRVPALEELAFWVESDADPDLQIFYSLLDRSSCRLRRVYLRGSPTARATTEILQKSSFVTELIVVNDYGAKDEVDALMATLTVSTSAGSTTVAPRLSLMFFGCSDKIVSITQRILAC